MKKRILSVLSVYGSHIVRPSSA